MCSRIILISNEEVYPRSAIAKLEEDTTAITHLMQFIALSKEV